MMMFVTKFQILGFVTNTLGIYLQFYVKIKFSLYLEMVTNLSQMTLYFKFHYTSNNIHCLLICQYFIVNIILPYHVLRETEMTLYLEMTIDKVRTR